MISLAIIQEKIRLGYALNPSEQAFVDKSTDDRGRISARKFSGLSEPPDSIADRLQL